MKLQALVRKHNYYVHPSKLFAIVNGRVIYLVTDNAEGWQYQLPVAYFSLKYSRAQLYELSSYVQPLENSVEAIAARELIACENWSALETLFNDAAVKINSER